MSHTSLHGVSFTIADTPPSLNRIGTRGSRFAVARAKKQWQNDIEKSLMAIKLPRGLQRVEASATLRFPVKRRRDYDNHSWLIAKSCGDALVRGAWIPDDAPQYFRFTGIEFDEECGPRQTTVYLRIQENGQ